MSVFTNPASAAKAEARDYVDAVLELLGERDPYEVLGQLVEAIEREMEGLSAKQLRTAEAPGKWSMVEVVQHLADSDTVWAWRLRQVLAEDRPVLTGYDQDRWAQSLRYRQVKPRDAMDQLRAIRTANLRLVRSLSAAELRRIGVHSERGEESVAHMIRLYAGHDLVHLRQLDRIREAVEG